MEGEQAKEEKQTGLGEETAQADAAEQQAKKPGGQGRNKWYRRAAIILLVVVGCGYLYSWLKSPEYALRQLQGAVAKHDVAAVQRYADIDGIYGKAFDQLATSALEKDKEVDAGTKIKLAAMGGKFKPIFVGMMKDKTVQSVETGKWEADSPDALQDYQRLPPAVSPKTFSERMGLMQLEVRDVVYVHKAGRAAIAGIKVVERAVGQEFILEVRLRDKEDGGWQIVEIANLQEYLAKVEAARRERLAELNRPLQEQLGQAILLGQVRTRKAGVGFAQSLEATIPVVYAAETGVAEWEGELLVKDSAGQLLFVGIFAAHPKAQKGQSGTLKYLFAMNQYFPGQETIIRATDVDLKKEVVVRRVRFGDGKELRLLDKLPNG